MQGIAHGLFHPKQDVLIVWPNLIVPIFPRPDLV